MKQPSPLFRSFARPQALLAFLILAAAGRVAAAPVVIDEGKVAQTFHVSPEGNDANAGDDANPFGTIQKAVDAAAGTATKIIMEDGVYRRYVEVGKGDNLLIFEARNPGKAIISGADILAGWKQTGTPQVWAREWMNKWGLNTENAWWGSTPLNRRREMLWVNDGRWSQRVTETGGAVAEADLKPGEFTIDEDSSQVLLHAPAGLDMGTARVEMAVRGHDTSHYAQTQAFSRPLFKVSDHSNLVLRGLVVTRAANAMKFGAALHIEGDQSVKGAAGLPRNVLVENCTVTENNAIGMEVNNYINVTVRNSRFNDNGLRGAGMLQVGAEQNADPKAKEFAPRNYLFEDCEFNHNNWRMEGTWGDMNDAAGFKAFGQCANGLVFIRCSFNGNLANGFWQDYAGSNTVLDRCMIENNSGTGAGGYGVLSEMTRGPITVKNSVIRNNTNAGFISSGSPDVTIQDSYLYWNNFTPGANHNYNCQEIRINSDVKRGSGDFEFSLKGWKLTGNTFASRGGNIGDKPVIGYIFQIGGDAFPDGLAPAAHFAKHVISENNAFSKNPTDHENGTGYNILYSLDATDPKPNITLEQWQAQVNAHGRQDQESEFVFPIDFTGVRDPTKVKPVR